MFISPFCRLSSTCTHAAVHEDQYQMVEQVQIRALIGSSYQSLPHGNFSSVPHAVIGAEKQARLKPSKNDIQRVLHGIGTAHAINSEDRVHS